MELHVMAGGAPLRQVQREAEAVAEAGLDGIVFTESGRTAYLSIAAATLAAPELEYSTGVAVAFPRSPMVTASVAWELAEATGGRFRLGLGTQVRAHIERRYGADFDPPGPRLREHVLAIKSIFRAFRGEEKLDFDGEYTQHTLLPPMWSPGPIDVPDPAIDIAAVGPWMVQMAGAVADGVHVHPLHSPTYLRERLVPGLAEGLDTSDRSMDDLVLSIPVFTIVGDSEDERSWLRDMARTQIAFYGSTRNYAFMFDMLGFEGTSARLNDRLKTGDIAGMAAEITDEMLTHFAVESTWDDLATQLRERYDGLADRLVLYFAPAMEKRQPGTLARFGEVAASLKR